MAIEVHGSCYYFRDPRPGDMGRPGDIELRAQMRKLPSVVKLPLFQHNCLHDLESTWWIGLWTTYVFAPEVPSEQDVYNFHRIFPAPLTPNPLRTSPAAPSLIHSQLLEETRPRQNELVFNAMNIWRKEVYMAYFTLESNRAHKGRLDESVFEYVHDNALRILNVLLAELQSDGLGRSKLVHMQFSGNKSSKKL